MGILNITPDSFSDGGRWLDPERAVRHALQMQEEGADLLDLGAESTRPRGGVYGEGPLPPSPEEELQRLLPVLNALREKTTLPISVDTRNGSVAKAALAHGADLINDVGSLGDDTLGEAVAEAGAPVILMHSRGHFTAEPKVVEYGNVCAEVGGELGSLMQRAQELGIDKGQVILDPGIGFGKGTQDNLRLIAGLDRLAGLGRPLLLGVSRKSFISNLAPAEPGDRLGGSLAAAAWAAQRGAAILRVHDVAATRQFLTLWAALANSL
jgi:dihydropteroate synthase